MQYKITVVAGLVLALSTPAVAISPDQEAAGLSRFVASYCQSIPPGYPATFPYRDVGSGKTVQMNCDFARGRLASLGVPPDAPAGYTPSFQNEYYGRDGQSRNGR